MVQSLLSARPEDRPGSALDVALAFEAFLKPATAKMIGGRVRDIHRGDRSPSTAACPTAPTSPARSRRTPAVLLGASVLAAAFFLLLALLLLPGGKNTPSGVPSGAQPALRESAHPPPPELPEVYVPVSTVPAGAGLFSGSSHLGSSPARVVVPRGKKSRRVLISLAGYEEAEVFLERENEETGITVTLTALPTGTVRIGAIPWARVTFRGTDMGITPIVIEKAPVGSHSLVLSNDELGIHRETMIQVREGSNPALVMDLTTGKTLK